MKWIIIALLILAGCAPAPVDLRALAIAETGARDICDAGRTACGRWQITATALEEYNALRGGKFSMEDMLQPQNCKKEKSLLP